jgi:hypothetical protein
VRCAARLYAPLACKPRYTKFTIMKFDGHVTSICTDCSSFQASKLDGEPRTSLAAISEGKPHSDFKLKSSTTCHNPLLCQQCLAKCGKITSNKAPYLSLSAMTLLTAVNRKTQNSTRRPSYVFLEANTFTKRILKPGSTKSCSAPFRIRNIHHHAKAMVIQTDKSMVSLHI